MSNAAVGILLDVGPHMSECPPGFDTPLKLAVECIKYFLQRKLLGESKDEFCVVLCGTEATDNNLADDDGNFSHISMVQQLSCVDWNLLEYFNQDWQSTNSTGDLIDAMIVSVDHMITKTSGKKTIGLKRLFIFSNLGGAINNDRLDRIVRKFKKAEVDIRLIGVAEESHDAPAHTGDHHPEAASSSSRDRSNNHHMDAYGKAKTRIQVQNEETFRTILDELGGLSHSFNDAMGVFQVFETRGKRQTAWKADLEIGEDLFIPIAAYTKVAEARPKSMKDVYAKDPDEPIEVQRTYHKEDEAETEVEADDTVKGYRFGNTVMPFTDEDVENLKVRSEKSFKLLGFAKKEECPEYLRVGGSILAVVSADEEHAVAFSALANALARLDYVAVVRRVYNAATAPRIGVLLPDIHAHHEALIFVEMACEEDLRFFQLPKLPLNDPVAGPSVEHLQAVDRLIDNMQLFNHEDATDAPSGELLKPSHVVSPYIQRLYQCVQARALAPNDPLPEVSELLRSLLDVPAVVQRRLQTDPECVDSLKKHFPLKKVAVKEKVKASDLFNLEENGEGSSEAKRSRVESDTVDLASLTRAAVTHVGSVDPVGDFQDLCRQGQQREACVQMTKRIAQLVQDSYQDQFYTKALECVKALRAVAAGSVELCNDIFNPFLQDWKRILLEPGSKRADFWRLLVSEGVSLIADVELPGSHVSQTEADQWAKEDHSSKSNMEEKNSNKVSNDVDDLLAELD